MIFDRRALSKYKTSLGKMLIAATKFGISKEKDTTAWLSHYVKGEDIYPVVTINQTTSPWGMRYTPAKLYITPLDIPIDIDVFGENKEYTRTDAAEININEFKKALKLVKELSMDDNRISIPEVIQYSKEVGYPEDLKEIESIKSLIEIPTTLSDHSVVIDDEETINKIRADLAKNALTELTCSNSGKIRLFYMNAPLKMDSLYVNKYTSISDEEIATAVHVQQNIGPIIVNNFYKYIDIWNMEGTSGK